MIGVGNGGGSISPDRGAGVPLAACPPVSGVASTGGQAASGTRGARRPGISASIWIALLVAWVVASRVPYLNHFTLMGKDGVFYVDALKLDRAYNVPPPGNVGYVLLGKAANQVIPDPVQAFAAVNIALTALGAAFCFLIAARGLPRPLAAASAFALTCNPLVWWYGPVVASYLVWLAILPAVAWFGLRFVEGRRQGDLIAISVTLGLGMILRQDLLAFGTPLWAGSLLMGRASRRQWLLGGSILAAACAGWFFGTAAVLGGPEVYLARVQAKHAHDLGYSVARRGLFEGLMRNASKYVLFLAWVAHLAIVPFLVGVLRDLRAARSRWRAIALAALWVAPSWYFAFGVFAGTAGLIFPLLPLVYIGSARGLMALSGRGRSWRPAMLMALLALAGAAQFTMTPLLRDSDQRRAILNVMFFRYSGTGLHARYNYDLADFGIDGSLKSVLRQLRTPGPLPRVPLPN